MGRVYSDTEKLLQAQKLEADGHHRKAAKAYQDMGNEERPYNQKKQMWENAEKCRNK